MFARVCLCEVVRVIARFFALHVHVLQSDATDTRRGVCVALLSNDAQKGSGGPCSPELLRELLFPLNRLDFLPLRLTHCDVPLHLCAIQVSC
jgi:hypothetical protein